MQKTSRTKIIAFSALATAAVYVGTLVGFSGGQFYFNLGDSVILIVAAMLGPMPAMLAGALGSFFADLTVYPATMLFTLFIKGIEGLLAGALLKLATFLSNYSAVSRLAKKAHYIYVPPSKKMPQNIKSISILPESLNDDTATVMSPSARRSAHFVLSFLATLAGCAIPTAFMACGYFICQTFFYGTYESALVALPFDAVQAAVSTAVATIVLSLFARKRIATPL